VHAQIDAGPGDGDGDPHQHHAGPQAMPEQEGQREGEDHRAVIARERVIRRMVQEVVADAIDKRTIVREGEPQHIAGQHADADGHRHFNYQVALGGDLFARAPKPEDRGQRRHDADQILAWR